MKIWRSWQLATWGVQSWVAHSEMWEGTMFWGPNELGTLEKPKESPCVWSLGVEGWGRWDVSTVSNVVSLSSEQDKMEAGTGRWYWSSFSKETESIGNSLSLSLILSLSLDSFILRNWFIQLWVLTSLKSVGQVVMLKIWVRVCLPLQKNISFCS
jgi:hypothetical protein